MESSANDFERGHTDTFVLEAPPIGDRVKQLEIRFKAKGLSADWHLDRVELEYSRGSEPLLVFPYAQWVKKTGTITLTPDRDGDGAADAAEDLNLIEYQVRGHASADVRGFPALAV